MDKSNNYIIRFLSLEEGNELLQGRNQKRFNMELQGIIPKYSPEGVLSSNATPLKGKRKRLCSVLIKVSIPKFSLS